MSIPNKQLGAPVVSLSPSRAQLAWVNTDRVDISERAGDDTTLRFIQQDGALRTVDVSTPLQWQPSNGVADLGLDTGAEASSTWYYLYLVPSTGDDAVLTVRGSVTHPNGGGDPTGYTNWTYIGSVYNQGTSDIRAIYHSGSRFSFSARITVQSLAGLAVDGSPVSVSLSSMAPKTAIVSRLSCKIEDTEQWQLDILGGNGILFAHQLELSGSGGGDSANIRVLSDDPTAQRFYRQLLVGGGTLNAGHIWCVGWIDGFAHV